MSEVSARPNARVPIVALEDEATKLKCDIGMCNELALINSQLIRAYVLLDARVRPLCLAVKRWAKRRQINDPYRGSLSSYAYVLLVLHYLQTTSPPLLPPLQLLSGGEWGESAERMSARTPDGKVFGCAFCADTRGVIAAAAAVRAHATPQPNRTLSVGELLCGFFQRYARDFEWNSQVVSVRTASYLTKQEKGWTTKEKGFRGDRHLFCIEDPFELTHDLGRVVDKNTIVDLKDEFKRAHKMLSQEASFAALCEPWQPEEPAKPKQPAAPSTAAAASPAPASLPSVEAGDKAQTKKPAPAPAPAPAAAGMA